VSEEHEQSDRRTGTACCEDMSNVSRRQEQRVSGEQEKSVGCPCSEFQKDKIGMNKGH
jgi:hypothetical protein